MVQAEALRHRAVWTWRDGKRNPERTQIRTSQRFQPKTIVMEKSWTVVYLRVVQRVVLQIQRIHASQKFCEAPTLPQVLVKVNHEILKKKKSIEKLNKRDFEYWTSSDLLFSSSFWRRSLRIREVVVRVSQDQRSRAWSVDPDDVVADANWDP